MKIEYEDETYSFDADDITVKQAMMIEKHTGLGFTAWSEALEAGGNLPALQAFGWIVLTGGDLGKPIEDCDFKLGRLGRAFAAAQAAESGAPPDPTQAASGSSDASVSSSAASSATA
jgi:hypothetical protein